MKKTWIISGWVNEDNAHTNLTKDKVDILCEVKTGGEDCDGFQEEGIAVVLDEYGSLSMIRTGNCTGEDYFSKQGAVVPLYVSGAKDNKTLANLLRVLADKLDKLEV
jgi:hypothetical protein